MTEPTTAEVEERVEMISEEIIETDHDLRGETGSADRTFKSAKERRASAYAALNQFRWEMCECPYGPQFSHRAYARAVGVAHTTVSRGVNAWQVVVDRDLVHDAPVCDYGSEPHHVPDAAPAEGTGPTDEQVGQHSEATKKATASELRVLAIEELGTRFGVAFDTMKSNTPLIKDALSRLNEYDIEGLAIEAVRPTMMLIALEIHQEYKLRAARESDIRRWMAANRGVESKDIPPSDITSMFTRIERVMKRKELSWAEAEAEVRVSDKQDAEAQKISNELARAARMAILDLRKSGADLKSASMSMIKAVKKIEADKIPLTDDERTLSIADLDAAEAAIHLARAALTGNSGTDWDAALASLTEGGHAA